MLYIVATPIGNLQDITLRAIETLKSVDLIAAEDTRHTGILLKHYGIATPQTSYFEHNKLKKAEFLIERLKQGENIALVSDAGTPGISDPGYHLISLAHVNGIEVTALPGACAAVTALSMAGFPTDRFCFEGFLPVKSAARRRKLEALKEEERTMVFYESPYRILKTLKDMAEVLSDPEIVVARELTKKFEELRRGRAGEVLAYFSGRTVKGEFVVMVKSRTAGLKPHQARPDA